MSRPIVADPKPSASSGGRPRPPAPVGAAWLERAALHYLERYNASSEMLRRTLARRVDRRARARGEDPAQFAGLVEATVARAVSAGLVDDARFAQARLATLRRRGASSRSAAARLAAKGVSRATVAAAMDAEREAAGSEEGADGGDPDASDADARAARAYARRRRIGPHRPPDKRADNRARDLAALARRGFGYDLARRVIDAEPGAEGG